MPQVNTFLMFSLEQLDMHMFGGNGESTVPTDHWNLEPKLCFKIVVVVVVAVIVPT